MKTIIKESLENKLSKPNFLLDIALSSALDELRSILGDNVKIVLHNKEERKIHFPSSIDNDHKPSYISDILRVADSLEGNAVEVDDNVEETSYVGILDTPFSLAFDISFSDLTEQQRAKVYDFVENKLSPGLRDIFEPQNLELEILREETNKLREQSIYETQFLRQSIPIHTRAYACDVLEGKLNRFSGAKLRAGAQPEDISVLVMDIDRFKHVNDELGGHANGDKVIYAVATSILDNVRSDDIVARYGAGDEFVVVLPNCSPENATKRAETIRRAVESTEVTLVVSPIKTIKYSPTVSIGGYSASHLEKADVANLLNSADTKLYEAKESGRNKVVFEGIQDKLKPSIVHPIHNETSVEIPQEDTFELTPEIKKTPFNYLSKSHVDEWTGLIEGENFTDSRITHYTPSNPKVPFGYLAKDETA